MSKLVHKLADKVDKLVSPTSSHYIHPANHLELRQSAQTASKSLSPVRLPSTLPALGLADSLTWRNRRCQPEPPPR